MNSPKKKRKNNKRRMARNLAMQALYQWAFTNEATDELVETFLFEHNVKSDTIDLAYFQTLLLGAIENIEAIDKLMAPHLDRDISRLNPVELAILRMAVYELNFHPEVPPIVAMNEAIELAKEFGATDGYKFINAVLNAMLPALKQG